MTYHLAIDIGASSGRHILGSTQNGKLHLEEIHRFENYITNLNGTFVWDIEHLVSEVKKGIAKCKKIGKTPCTVAIDTWGVDYVLLDKNKQEIIPAVSCLHFHTLLKILRCLKTYFSNIVNISTNNKKSIIFDIICFCVVSEFLHKFL